MKHPVLARLFAIALAIMCALLIVSGVGGLRDAAEQHQLAVRDHGRMLERVETYEQLKSELEGSESYEELSARLEELTEDHALDSSDHKTELATYSATKGGLQSGADMLYEARAGLDEAREQYNAARKIFDEQYTAFQQGKTALAAAWRQYHALNGAASALTAGSALPTLSGSENREAVIAAYDALASAADGAADAASVFSQLPSIDEGTRTMLTGLAQSIAGISQTAGERNAALRALDDATFDVAAAAAEAGVYNGLQGNLALIGDSVAAPLTQLLSPMETQLNVQQAQVDAAEPGLESAKANLDQAKTQLDGGAAAVQGGLEQIWYQLGEVKKDIPNFEEEKKKLDEQAAEIASLRERAELRETQEKKLTSTRLALLDYDGVEDDGDLALSAKNAAETLLSQSEYSYKMRRMLNLAALVGAALGLFGLLGAFEALRSRFLLIAPVLLCVALTAGAEYLNVYIGDGQHYTALFTAIVGFVDLLVILPKQKKTVPGLQKTE